MDLKAIEYICAIVEAKTITGAAKNLFISQPALSQYLNKIERELGASLFVRNGNVMQLTPAGELLVREGRTMLLDRDRIVARINQLSTASQEVLRFGISPFYSKYYLPLLIPYYREHFPNIRLDIIEMPSTDLENEVLSGRLDFCLAPATPMQEGLTYQTIFIEEIMIAVPPTHPVNKQATPSAGIPYLDISLLKDEPFIALIPTLKFSKMSQLILRHFAISANIIYETSNWDTICMLVAKGVGVGFVPAVLMHCYTDEPNFYRIAHIDSTRAYAAIHKSGEQLSLTALNLINVFANNLQSYMSWLH